jgi:hypothetical protein
MWQWFQWPFRRLGKPHLVAVLDEDCFEGLDYVGFVIDDQDSAASIYTCHDRLLGKNAKANVSWTLM